MSFLETGEGQYYLQRKRSTYFDKCVYELKIQRKIKIQKGVHTDDLICSMKESSWKFKAIVRFMYMGKISTGVYNETSFWENNVLAFSLNGSKKDDEFALACKLIPASSWKTWKYIAQRAGIDNKEVLEHLRPVITSYLLAKKT
jgi:hypothetical protein